MNRRKMAVALAVMMVANVAVPVIAEASTNFDMRKKVVGTAGIMSLLGMNQEVSRGEFARMLVNASSYHSTISQMSNTAVYADVPKTNEYAAYIRVAAAQGWMSGYLGGNFKPETSVTMQEAAKSVLALLGYTNEDFTGDQTGGRFAMFYHLKLNDEINKEADEVITKEDCVNLFYNLMKTNPKSSNTHYGSIFGCELTSDGEINPLTLADSSLKGPKLVRSRSSLSHYLPFTLGSANLYLNGQPTTLDTIESVLESSYLLIYFHPGSKTVWAYSEDSGEENQGKYIMTGVITNIVYSSVHVMTPSAVILDDGYTYELSGSEMQFAFSMYGSLRIGDEVTLVYQREQNNEAEVRTVLDYIGD